MYVITVLFFIIAVASYLTLEGLALNLMVISTVALGIVFAFLGYYNRPKVTVMKTEVTTETPKLPKTETTGEAQVTESKTCPNCGTKVLKARKTWKMAGRPDKAGKRTQLEIGIFDCPNCNKAFREVLSKKKI